MVRKLKFAEHGLALDWLRANKAKNALDENVLDYPRSEVVISEKTVLPMHLTLTLESLGHAPDATVADKLKGSVDCVHEAERKAVELGVKEIYYVSSDDRVDQFAVKHLGFEAVLCLRKKL